MRRIALNPCGKPILHGDKHSASVRTIMRAGGVDDLLHHCQLYGEAWGLLRLQKPQAAQLEWAACVELLCPQAYCSTRTRCAQTIGFLLTGSESTRPRASRLAEPAA